MTLITEAQKPVLLSTMLKLHAKDLEVQDDSGMILLQRRNRQGGIEDDKTYVVALTVQNVGPNESPQQAVTHGRVKTAQTFIDTTLPGGSEYEVALAYFLTEGDTHSPRSPHIVFQCTPEARKRLQLDRKRRVLLQARARTIR